MKTFLVTFTPKGGQRTQVTINAYNSGQARTIIQETYKPAYIGTIQEVK
jgi:hypothetical protein